MRTLSAFLLAASITAALFVGSAQAQSLTSLTINNSGGPTLNVTGGTLNFLGMAATFNGTWDYTWTLLKNGSEIRSEKQSLACDATFPCAPSIFRYQTPAACMTGTYQLKLKVSRFFIPTSQTQSNPIAVSAPGSPTPVLKVNGQKGLNIDVCAVGPITVDGSQSTCASGYFLSMQLSDSSWHGSGPEAMRWLTAADFGKYGPINNFNAKAFAENQFFKFVPGQYYRLKLATGSPWAETTSLLHILGSTASLTINGSKASPTVVDAAGPIRLNGSTSICASGYFVSVQLSDPSWHRFGPEAMRWLTAADFGKYGPINNFDVKKFAEDQFFKFVPGQYYRVKLAVGSPWSESTMLIRVTAWTPWLNADRPGGAGDFEALSSFVQAGKACSNPAEIQCQTTSGVDWKAAGQAYTCNVTQGGICVNSNQGSSGGCLDYRVRFRC